MLPGGQQQVNSSQTKVVIEVDRELEVRPEEQDRVSHHRDHNQERVRSLRMSSVGWEKASRLGQGKMVQLHCEQSEGTRQRLPLHGR